MPRIPGTTALLLALALATACDAVVACPEGQIRCAGVCRDAVSFQTDADNCGACGVVCGLSGCADGACRCGGLTPRACGDACCAGTDCCASGCQTAHANGLGKNYYDCGALDEWTVEQARLAGEAWSPTGTTWQPAQCSLCLCRQSTGQAAVWCYTGSNAPGLVLVTPTENCLAAWCPTPGNGLSWH